MEQNDVWSKFNFSDKEEKSALVYLHNLKEGLSKKTAGELKMEVTAVDGYIDGNPPKLAAIYTLYIVAPRLGNFRRKVLTVADYSDVTTFPVDIVNHFDGNKKISKVLEKDFLKEIEGIISSQEVKTSIENLFRQSIESGKQAGFDLLKPNHAGVILLKNGKTINYGVIRIENENLIHYTGKGLRDLWSPGRTEAELKAAQDLLALDDESKLRELDYLDSTPISEIERVLY